MADDSHAHSHRLKAKSKWGKLLHKDKAGANGNFKLNEDVVDFLKPSTDKYSAEGTQQWSSAPRIDVAIAQRWPEMAAVRRATEGEGTPTTGTRTPGLDHRPIGKQKRRKNLTVGFAKTAPEIIGEGGDEAEAPVNEISRARAKSGRSFSDRKPPPMSPPVMPLIDAGAAAAYRRPQNYPMSAPGEDHYARPDMHRSRTSAGENSYHVSQRPIPREPRPLRQPVPYDFQEQEPDRGSPQRPAMLKRAGTVFSDYDEDSLPSTPNDSVPTLPSLPRLPDIVPMMLRSPPDVSPPQRDGSPIEANRLFVKKAQHRMNAEGRAFRRVSRQEWNADDLANLQNLADVESPPKEPPSARLMEMLSNHTPAQDQGYGAERRSARQNDPSGTSHESLHTLQDSARGSQPMRKRGESIPEHPFITASQSNHLQHQFMPKQQSTYYPPPPVSEHQSMQTSQFRSPDEQQQSASEQRSMHARQQSIPVHQSMASNLQFSPIRKSVPEPQPNITLSIPADEERNDSMRSKYAPAQEDPTPPIVPPHTSNRAPSPSRVEQMDVPRINTTFDSRDHTGERMHHSSEHHNDRSRSIADTLSAASASSRTPASLNYPSPNMSRPGGLQEPPNGFQGITPTPTGGPTNGYFPSHQPQSLSPSIGSPTTFYENHGPIGRSLSQASQASMTSQTSQYKPFTPHDGQTDSPEHVAFNDFDARVAHMKGVFRLTAEREQPASITSPRSWLRAAVWWLHRGRAGLGQVVKNLPRGPDGQKREFLAQPHVDVAKAWWILTDMLHQVSSPVVGSPTGQDSLRRDVDVVRSHLRSLTLSMQRNGVMPPHQSLIQGQDTTIWIHYPRFAADASALLRGSKTLMLDDDHYETDPLEALPAGDTRNAFLYNRMFVNVSINTDDSETDRVVLPCVLSMLRSKADWQPTIVISSQTDLVNIQIKPDTAGNSKGPTWRDVSWKARSHGMYVSLPRGFNMNVELQEHDFRGLHSMLEYTRKIEAGLVPHSDEQLVHQARLHELQYSDSSNPHAFPREKVRACTALVFEKFVMLNEGTGARKLHRGFRVLFVTNPINKTLSSVTHDLCRGAPLLFETAGNPAANELPVMILRVQEAKRSCKIMLVFGRGEERQHLHDVLGGIVLAPYENVTGTVPLTSVSFEAAAASSSNGPVPAGGALQSLKWQGLKVINKPAERGDDSGHTVLSENLRMVATHDSGSITDRLNLGPGELLFRLPIQKPTTIQLLRAPQEDLSLSLDVRRSQNQQHLPQDVTELMKIITTKPTIRSLTFASSADLYKFQQSIMRFDVRFDSSASLFAISRRRMVVPIYKKLETNHVRLQIMTHDSKHGDRKITQIAAFFEEWSIADALVFQVRASDTFEKAKGEKGAKFCVKLVDAKFTLPAKEKHEEIADDEHGGVWPKGVKRRFLNLEGLEYAEEHDDITIGFETEDDRDRFCEQLPAATTTKKFDLRRKI